jgi:hypothetical protein
MRGLGGAHSYQCLPMFRIHIGRFRTDVVYELVQSPAGVDEYLCDNRTHPLLAHFVAMPAHLPVFVQYTHTSMQIDTHHMLIDTQTPTLHPSAKEYPPGSQPKKKTFPRHPNGCLQEHAKSVCGRVHANANTFYRTSMTACQHVSKNKTHVHLDIKMNVNTHIFRLGPCYTCPERCSLPKIVSASFFIVAN